MHRRRIPTLISVALILAGSVLLLLPYRAHIRVTMGGERTDYSLQCQAPLVDRVTSDPPQVWHLRGTNEVAVGTGPSYPSPCHDERDVRLVAGAILIVAGAAVSVIPAVLARRHRRRGSTSDEVDSGLSSARG